ncbi:MAG: tRNA (adenosine(37)-N6)-threonylcarbamoyltransferase complex dimerization subunit type 1 TsaB [Proteobacteria bacterium]|nr:tRNA (adenosine(37)-N6)-threonylcarbamoyltransferase complex dimerization subunit type 1 TsaB [Pseudomonadota bacterium]MBU1738457.1 tRNA (adenosine(37)-N6)-threonylcarbamoyltransferase complex dimerization subunit type 1 TsaB [Pseudomonadota bacterium]
MTVKRPDQGRDPGPKVLAIETATQCGSVALLAGDVCLAENTINSTTTHSRRITSQIEYVMRECGVEWVDLDCIAVSLGPGSFTGLRIGLSTAKGFSMACEIPLVGVPTLDALALQMTGQPGTMICPVIDARKNEIYCALYKCDSDGRPALAGEYLVIHPGDLTGMIESPTLFIGNGTEVYGELFRRELGGKYLPAPVASFMPRAATVGMIGSGYFQDDKIGDPATMVPIYVRPSEAEVSLSEKQTRIKT